MEIIRNTKELPDYLYHGTTSDCLESLIAGIILTNSRKRTDFGAGFYLTSNYEQASEWARFKKSRLRNEKLQEVVMRYEVNKPLLEGLRFLRFEDTSDEWADFIYANRELVETMPNNLDARFDVVYGALGDGFKISKEIERRRNDPTGARGFGKRIISKKYPFPVYHQYSFHTVESLKALSLKGVELI